MKKLKRKKLTEKERGKVRRKREKVYNRDNVAKMLIKRKREGKKMKERML